MKFRNLMILKQCAKVGPLVIDDMSWNHRESLCAASASKQKMNKLGFEILICPTGGLGSNSMLEC